MKKFLILVLSLFTMTAFAAEPVACDGLKIATGPAGKGYSKLFSDVNRVCGSTIPLCEVNSEGGLDNLGKLSMNEADVGFAQIDTAMYMQSGDENVRELLAVMSTNFNYLHIIVSSNGYVTETKAWGGLKKEQTVTQVRKASDLRGLTVVAVGSAQLLARKLNDSLNMGMNIVDASSDSAAFDLIKKGQAHAAMSVSGWPSGPISQLTSSGGLTMIPWDLMANMPYSVKPLNYKGLGVYNVNSLAIPNVLMTRPFKGTKVAEVSKLKACLKNALLDLQEGSYQPAWKEIKDMENVYGWNKFSPAATTAIATGKRKQ
jgi:hypothetical protein